MLRRTILCATTAAALAALRAPAAAEEVHGTRFDARERAHVIDARLERGHAVLVVTRVVENTGPKSDQALLWLDLPNGAVATRLRTAGTTATGAPIWFEGELMEAEAAATKYQELTGIGGYYPKDPALLSWRSQGHLALQVFPVPARASKTVEYTLKLPMEYETGCWSMKLPSIGTASEPAKIRFAAAHPEDTIEVNGVRLAPGSTVTANREIEVRLAPRGAPWIDGALASYRFAPNRVLVHARLAAAPRMAEPPARSAVVILLDTSRSMEPVLTNALAAIQAYVHQLSGADVELMTFARSVKSPFGGPLPAGDLAAKLYSLAPKLENGSNLDDALGRADAKLAQSAAPARRIVLVTDLRTKETLTAERVAAKKLGSGAILHLATVASGAASLTRDDDAAWATVPRKTGGVLWHATIDASSDPAARSVFEEWVRPKRIDRLVVKGMPEDWIAPAVLDEGAVIEHLDVATSNVSQLSLEGELWSRSVRYSTSPSAEEGKLWAALAFGSGVLGQLTDDEQMTLAMHGRAVSPVTSYLAIEPGVRPSTEGLEPELSSLGHGAGTGTGHGFGSGSGRLTTRVSPLERQRFLDNALGSALDACQATGTAGVTIESTVREIVDVREVSLTPKSTNAESCVAEQMWGLTLTEAFLDEHGSFKATAKR